MKLVLIFALIYAVTAIPTLSSSSPITLEDVEENLNGKLAPLTNSQITRKEKILVKRFIPFLTDTDGLDLSFSSILGKFTTVIDYMGFDTSGLKLLQKLYNSAFARSHLLFKRKVLNLIMQTCSFILRYLPEEPVQRNPQLYQLNGLDDEESANDQNQLGRKNVLRQLAKFGKFEEFDPVDGEDAVADNEVPDNVPDRVVKLIDFVTQKPLTSTIATTEAITEPTMTDSSVYYLKVTNSIRDDDDDDIINNRIVKRWLEQRLRQQETTESNLNKPKESDEMIYDFSPFDDQNVVSDDADDVDDYFLYRAANEDYYYPHTRRNNLNRRMRRSAKDDEQAKFNEIQKEKLVLDGKQRNNPGVTRSEFYDDTKKIENEESEENLMDTTRNTRQTFKVTVEEGDEGKDKTNNIEEINPKKISGIEEGLKEKDNKEEMKKEIISGIKENRKERISKVGDIEEINKEMISEIKEGSEDEHNNNTNDNEEINQESVSGMKENYKEDKIEEINKEMITGIKKDIEEKGEDDRNEGVVAEIKEDFEDDLNNKTNNNAETISEIKEDIIKNNKHSNNEEIIEGIREGENDDKTNKHEEIISGERKGLEEEEEDKSKISNTNSKESVNNFDNKKSESHIMKIPRKAKIIEETRKTDTNTKSIGEEYKYTNNEEASNNPSNSQVEMKLFVLDDEFSGEVYSSEDLDESEEEGDDENEDNSKLGMDKFNGHGKEKVENNSDVEKSGNLLLEDNRNIEEINNDKVEGGKSDSVDVTPKNLNPNDDLKHVQQFESHIMKIPRRAKIGKQLEELGAMNEILKGESKAASDEKKQISEEKTNASSPKVEMNFFALNEFSDEYNSDEEIDDSEEESGDEDNKDNDKSINEIDEEEGSGSKIDEDNNDKEESVNELELDEERKPSGDLEDNKNKDQSDERNNTNVENVDKSSIEAKITEKTSSALLSKPKNLNMIEDTKKDKVELNRKFESHIMKIPRKPKTREQIIKKQEISNKQNVNQNSDSGKNKSESKVEMNSFVLNQYSEEYDSNEEAEDFESEETTNAILKDDEEKRMGKNYKNLENDKNIVTSVSENKVSKHDVEVVNINVKTESHIMKIPKKGKVDEKIKFLETTTKFSVEKKDVPKVEKKMFVLDTFSEEDFSDEYQETEEDNEDGNEKETISKYEAYDLDSSMNTITRIKTIGSDDEGEEGEEVEDNSNVETDDVNKAMLKNTHYTISTENLSNDISLNLKGERKKRAAEGFDSVGEDEKNFEGSDRVYRTGKENVDRKFTSVEVNKHNLETLKKITSIISPKNSSKIISFDVTSNILLVKDTNDTTETPAGMIIASKKKIEAKDDGIENMMIIASKKKIGSTENKEDTGMIIASKKKIVPKEDGTENKQEDNNFDHFGEEINGKNVDQKEGNFTTFKNLNEIISGIGHKLLNEYNKTKIVDDQKPLEDYNKTIEENVANVKVLNKTSLEDVKNTNSFEVNTQTSFYGEEEKEEKLNPSNQENIEKSSRLRREEREDKVITFKNVDKFFSQIGQKLLYKHNKTKIAEEISTSKPVLIKTEDRKFDDDKELESISRNNSTENKKGNLMISKSNVTKKKLQNSEETSTITNKLTSNLESEEDEEATAKEIGLQNNEETPVNTNLEIEEESSATVISVEENDGLAKTKLGRRMKFIDDVPKDRKDAEAYFEDLHQNLEKIRKEKTDINQNQTNFVDVKVVNEMVDVPEDPKQAEEHFEDLHKNLESLKVKVDGLKEMNDDNIQKIPKDDELGSFERNGRPENGSKQKRIISDKAFEGEGRVKHRVTDNILGNNQYTTDNIQKIPKDDDLGSFARDGRSGKASEQRKIIFDKDFEGERRLKHGVTDNILGENQYTSEGKGDRLDGLEGVARKERGIDDDSKIDVPEMMMMMNEESHNILPNNFPDEESEFAKLHEMFENVQKTMDDEENPKNVEDLNAQVSKLFTTIDEVMSSKYPDEKAKMVKRIITGDSVAEYEELLEDVFSKGKKAAKEAKMVKRIITGVSETEYEELLERVFSKDKRATNAKAIKSKIEENKYLGQKESKPNSEEYNDENDSREQIYLEDLHTENGNGIVLAKNFQNSEENEMFKNHDDDELIAAIENEINENENSAREESGESSMHSDEEILVKISEGLVERLKRLKDKNQSVGQRIDAILKKVRNGYIEKVGDVKNYSVVSNEDEIEENTSNGFQERGLNINNESATKTVHINTESIIKTVDISTESTTKNVDISTESAIKIVDINTESTAKSFDVSTESIIKTVDVSIESTTKTVDLSTESITNNVDVSTESTVEVISSDTNKKNVSTENIIAETSSNKDLQYLTLSEAEDGTDGSSRLEESTTAAIEVQNGTEVNKTNKNEENKTVWNAVEVVTSNEDLLEEIATSTTLLEEDYTTDSNKIKVFEDHTNSHEDYTSTGLDKKEADVETSNEDLIEGHTSTILNTHEDEVVTSNEDLVKDHTSTAVDTNEVEVVTLSEDLLEDKSSIVTNKTEETTKKEEDKVNLSETKFVLRCEENCTSISNIEEEINQKEGSKVVTLSEDLHKENSSIIINKIKNEEDNITFNEDKVVTSSEEKLSNETSLFEETSNEDHTILNGIKNEEDEATFNEDKVVTSSDKNVSNETSVFEGNSNEDHTGLIEENKSTVPNDFEGSTTDISIGNGLVTSGGSEESTIAFDEGQETTTSSFKEDLTTVENFDHDLTTVADKNEDDGIISNVNHSDLMETTLQDFMKTSDLPKNTLISVHKRVEEHINFGNTSIVLIYPEGYDVDDVEKIIHNMRSDSGINQEDSALFKDALLITVVENGNATEGSKNPKVFRFEESQDSQISTRNRRNTFRNSKPMKNFQNITELMKNVIKNINGEGEFAVTDFKKKTKKYVQVVVHKSLILKTYQVAQSRKKRQLSTGMFAGAIQRFRQLSPSFQGFSNIQSQRFVIPIPQRFEENNYQRHQPVNNYVRKNYRHQHGERFYKPSTQTNVNNYFDSLPHYERKSEFNGGEILSKPDGIIDVFKSLPHYNQKAGFNTDFINPIVSTTNTPSFDDVNTKTTPNPFDETSDKLRTSRPIMKNDFAQVTNAPSIQFVTNTPITQFTTETENPFVGALNSLPHYIRKYDFMEDFTFPKHTTTEPNFWDNLVGRTKQQFPFSDDVDLTEHHIRSNKMKDFQEKFEETGRNFVDAKISFPKYLDLPEHHTRLNGIYQEGLKLENVDNLYGNPPKTSYFPFPTQNPNNDWQQMIRKQFEEYKKQLLLEGNQKQHFNLNSPNQANQNVQPFNNKEFTLQPPADFIGTKNQNVQTSNNQEFTLKPPADFIDTKNQNGFEKIKENPPKTSDFPQAAQNLNNNDWQQIIRKQFEEYKKQLLLEDNQKQLFNLNTRNQKNQNAQTFNNQEFRFKPSPDFIDTKNQKVQHFNNQEFSLKPPADFINTKNQNVQPSKNQEFTLKPPADFIDTKNQKVQPFNNQEFTLKPPGDFIDAKNQNGFEKIKENLQALKNVEEVKNQFDVKQQFDLNNLQDFIRKNFEEYKKQLLEEANRRQTNFQFDPSTQPFRENFENKKAQPKFDFDPFRIANIKNNQAKRNSWENFRFDPSERPFKDNFGPTEINEKRNRWESLVFDHSHDESINNKRPKRREWNVELVNHGNLDHLKVNFGDIEKLNNLQNFEEYKKHLLLQAEEKIFEEISRQKQNQAFNNNYKVSSTEYSPEFNLNNPMSNVEAMIQSSSQEEFSEQSDLQEEISTDSKKTVEDFNQDEELKPDLNLNPCANHKHLEFSPVNVKDLFEKQNFESKFKPKIFGHYQKVPTSQPIFTPNNFRQDYQIFGRPYPPSSTLNENSFNEEIANTELEKELKPYPPKFQPDFTRPSNSESNFQEEFSEKPFNTFPHSFQPEFTPPSSNENIFQQGNINDNPKNPQLTPQLTLATDEEDITDEILEGMDLIKGPEPDKPKEAIHIEDEILEGTGLIKEPESDNPEAAIRIEDEILEGTDLIKEPEPKPEAIHYFIKLVPDEAKKTKPASGAILEGTDVVPIPEVGRIEGIHYAINFGNPKEEDNETLSENEIDESEQEDNIKFPVRSTIKQEEIFNKEVDQYDVPNKEDRKQEEHAVYTIVEDNPEIIKSDRYYLIKLKQVNESEDVNVLEGVDVVERPGISKPEGVHYMIKLNSNDDENDSKSTSADDSIPKHILDTQNIIKGIDLVEESELQRPEKVHYVIKLEENATAADNEDQNILEGTDTVNPFGEAQPEAVYYQINLGSTDENVDADTSSESLKKIPSLIVPSMSSIKVPSTATKIVPNTISAPVPSIYSASKFKGDNPEILEGTDLVIEPGNNHPEGVHYKINLGSTNDDGGKKLGNILEGTDVIVQSEGGRDENVHYKIKFDDREHILEGTDVIAQPEMQRSEGVHYKIDLGSLEGEIEKSKTSTLKFSLPIEEKSLDESTTKAQTLVANYIEAKPQGLHYIINLGPTGKNDLPFNSGKSKEVEGNQQVFKSAKPINFIESSKNEAEINKTAEGEVQIQQFIPDIFTNVDDDNNESLIFPLSGEPGLIIDPSAEINKTAEGEVQIQQFIPDIFTNLGDDNNESLIFPLSGEPGLIIDPSAFVPTDDVEDIIQANVINNPTSEINQEASFNQNLQNHFTSVFNEETSSNKGEEENPSSIVVNTNILNGYNIPSGALTTLLEQTVSNKKSVVGDEVISTVIDENGMVLNNFEQKPNRMKSNRGDVFDYSDSEEYVPTQRILVSPDHQRIYNKEELKSAIIQFGLDRLKHQGQTDKELEATNSKNSENLIDRLKHQDEETKSIEETNSKNSENLFDRLKHQVEGTKPIEDTNSKNSEDLIQNSYPIYINNQNQEKNNFRFGQEDEDLKPIVSLLSRNGLNMIHNYIFSKAHTENYDRAENVQNIGNEERILNNIIQHRLNDDDVKISTTQQLPNILSTETEETLLNKIFEELAKNHSAENEEYIINGLDVLYHQNTPDEEFSNETVDEEFSTDTVNEDGEDLNNTQHQFTNLYYDQNNKNYYESIKNKLSSVNNSASNVRNDEELKNKPIDNNLELKYSLRNLISPQIVDELQQNLPPKNEEREISDLKKLQNRIQENTNQDRKVVKAEENSSRFVLKPAIIEEVRKDVKNHIEDEIRKENEEKENVKDRIVEDNDDIKIGEGVTQEFINQRREEDEESLKNNKPANSENQIASDVDFQKQLNFLELAIRPKVVVQNFVRNSKDNPSEEVKKQRLNFKLPIIPVESGISTKQETPVTEIDERLEEIEKNLANQLRQENNDVSKDGAGIQLGKKNLSGDEDVKVHIDHNPEAKLSRNEGFTKGEVKRKRLRLKLPIIPLEEVKGNNEDNLQEVKREEVVENNEDIPEEKENNVEDILQTHLDSLKSVIHPRTKRYFGSNAM